MFVPRLQAPRMSIPEMMRCRRSGSMAGILWCCMKLSSAVPGSTVSAIAGEMRDVEADGLRNILFPARIGEGRAAVNEVYADIVEPLLSLAVSRHWMDWAALCGIGSSISGLLQKKTAPDAQAVHPASRSALEIVCRKVVNGLASSVISAFFLNGVMFPGAYSSSSADGRARQQARVFRRRNRRSARPRFRDMPAEGMLPYVCIPKSSSRYWSEVEK